MTDAELLALLGEERLVAGGEDGEGAAPDLDDLDRVIRAIGDDQLRPGVVDRPLLAARALQGTAAAKYAHG